ncbi:MAG: phenylalanine--tRNA ligase subunit beta, partial [Actinomycetota bacterium]
GVALANPPSAEEPFLRRSLVPNLLKALARTTSRGARGAALFEVGHVFHPADPVDEREMVAAVLTGPAVQGPFDGDRSLDFFDGKGALEALLAGLAIEAWNLGAPPVGPLHPGRSASVEIGGEQAGVIGELHPRVAQRLDLPPRVALFELDVAALAGHSVNEVTYRDIPRYPPIRRDVAFTLEASTPAADVRSALEDAAGELLGSAVLFDVFEGEPLPQGKKSLAFSLELRALDRTLTDAEADAALSSVIERLRHDFGAELRAG